MIYHVSPAGCDRASGHESAPLRTIGRAATLACAGDTVRVWVPGCATGEEVFSSGILMREHLETLRHECSSTMAKPRGRGTAHR